MTGGGGKGSARGTLAWSATDMAAILEERGGLLGFEKLGMRNLTTEV